MFKEFKIEIENAKTQKEINFIFLQVGESKELTPSQFSLLKYLINEKYKELATEEQLKQQELAKMDYINKFKVNVAPISEEEEWRGDILYCKKCETPRSFILPQYSFTTRIKCSCQTEKLKQEEEEFRKQQQKTKCLEKLYKIGINPENYGFNKFKATKDYQKRMLEVAKVFLTDISKGFVITGQSGAGKTHILSSVVIELVNMGFNVEYLKWQEKGKYLKSIVNDTELYQRELSILKTCQVLYIDDFLKVGKNGVPTDADINLAFEILDYRKENKLSTIISSERSLEEMIYIDEAVAGRVIEICRNRIELKDFKNVENYRLKF